MSEEPVIAIFDIGKTNKKIFLFDQDYNKVYEKMSRFDEVTDEDGFPCEDVMKLSEFVFDSLKEISRNKEFSLKALNFSTYGASFVHIGKDGMPVTPLYNYLKPFPEDLKKEFYDKYGGEEKFAKVTASPVLGNLNSGMQLYLLKCRKPDLYRRIKHSLHLPQFMSYLVTGNFYSDITSIGCHTNLWDFTKNDYHEWVYNEGVINKLSPVIPCTYSVAPAYPGVKYRVGVGLHDSSAALIPYLVTFNEPFILLSTGTWCISLNPFNENPLTSEELECDCLSFMSYEGKQVKASRFFGGNEYEQQVNRIAAFFHKDVERYKSMEFNADLIQALRSKKDNIKETDVKTLINSSVFGKRDLSMFKNDEEAYHQLMLDIVDQQYASTQLVLKGAGIKKIFVDGGFSKNRIYMQLLAAMFPGQEVSAASMAQATAVGAALSIHQAWNTHEIPGNLITSEYYPAKPGNISKK
jgi:sugar (pentulose or hexulose) kinase